MDIPASVPVITPFVPSVTYNLWTICSVNIEWPSLQHPLQLEAMFRIAARDEYGQLMVGNTFRSFSIPDLWQLVGTDTEVTEAFVKFTQALTNKARDAGVI